MPARDEHLSESALLRRLRAGEELAFELLYERYQPRVYRYVLRMCGRPETADDVVQEVFLSLMRGQENYDPHSGALGSYLYGMARNLTFRRLGEDVDRELEEDDSVIDADPLEGMSREEQIQQVRQALRVLPAHYREVVVLCDMEEMAYVEAAEVLGVAVGTVRSRLHRARALLLERLSEERCRA